MIAETTALGAGFLAGLATGVWSSTADLAAIWRLDRRFSPGERDDTGYARWRAAVGQARGWASAVPQPRWSRVRTPGARAGRFDGGRCRCKRKRWCADLALASAA